ncbi:uncharacterized protein LOC117111710 isoform X2 [Anneissia japonica]|uniref:uncharacterized protein LOC117111710 isoform X2 n=1 Tax=Anneissia japonica TaxID=1529436 RepID=UPI0014256928|nr:uncharacterized protein LOC117111710 isoform X2 [Anneissia japonica]
MSSVYKPSFGAFDKDTKFAKIQPPLCHMIGRVTGGLAMLYRKIKTKQIHSQQELHYEYGSCTEENGVFNPGLIEEVPLLGKRYEYSKVIGSGISSVLVQAVDTYRQNQYQVAIKILHTDYKMLGCQAFTALDSLRPNATRQRARSGLFFNEDPFRRPLKISRWRRVV